MLSDATTSSIVHVFKTSWCVTVQPKVSSEPASKQSTTSRQVLSLTKPSRRQDRLALSLRKLCSLNTISQVKLVGSSPTQITWSTKSKLEALEFQLLSPRANGSACRSIWKQSMSISPSNATCVEMCFLIWSNQPNLAASANQIKPHLEQKLLTIAGTYERKPEYI